VARSGVRVDLLSAAALSAMPFRQVAVSGLPAIALRTDELEVVAVPAAGMKLTNLRRPRGREWLWRNDQIPLAQPRESTSFVETADSGGWDECFPTVGACPIPGAPAESPHLPDHGELWSATWTSSAYEHADGVTLAAAAIGSLLPYEFHRELTLDPHEPVLRVRYRLRHTGDSPFPWIWCAHPLFNVQPGTTIELPSLRQVKVDAVHGLTGLSPGDIVSWPEAFGGAAGRFTFPDRGTWAVKLFGDVGPSGRMVLTDPRHGERLEIVARSEEVSQVGMWINNRGWAPAGRQPYYNLGLEPAIGAPDRLDQAVRDWKTAETLVPGEDRGWGFDVRLLEDGAA
jgi:galactose mutarotase-like enzyme